MPRKTRNTQNKRENNTSKRCWTKGAEAMADIIENNARHIGLINIHTDTVTPGDGTVFIMQSYNN